MRKRSVVQIHRSQRDEGARDIEKHNLSRLLDISFYPALLAGMIVIFVSVDDRSFAASLFMKLIRMPNVISVATAALYIPYRCLMVAVLLFATPTPAMAETIDAVYRATLAGIPIG
jgi:hypothetical protein